VKARGECTRRTAWGFPKGTQTLGKGSQSRAEYGWLAVIPGTLVWGPLCFFFVALFCTVLGADTGPRRR
jgi:hypothetical protein